MAVTPSTMLPLGTRMPDFDLSGLENETVSPRRFEGASAVLVVFMCPHCPYVKHIRSGLAGFAREYQDKGLALVAINSNDAAAFPEDSLEGMRQEARSAGYTFPYLFDETQSVAKAYQAACTPDFFLFDGDRKLVYRGQFDGSRPGNGVPVTGADMRAAADAVLRGETPGGQQQPSVGCNIKWKPGNQPAYFAG